MQVEALPSLSVSRETMDKLRAFEDLTRRWTKRINLISPSTIDDIWTRHIIDSLQVGLMSDSTDRWLDIGSGGGFPGIPIAILLAEKDPNAQITLVESDQRKCVFLKTAVSQLKLKTTVLAERVEALEPFKASTLSARALAPLKTLLAYADRHLVDGGAALFQKGEKWKSEVQEAEQKWSFDYDVIESVTEDSAAILRVANIIKKN